MRLPPSLRYLPSRLQLIFNPWLWLGILITGIVGIYAWEYRQNPGQVPWQLNATGESGPGNSTSADALLDSLTPEEQAVAAELDNIDLLLSELEADVSVLTSGGESSAAAALNAALADPSIAEAANESPVTRLNRYIDEYNFIGTNARGANGVTLQSQDGEPPQPESVLTLTPFSTTDQATNAGSRQRSQPGSPTANVDDTSAEGAEQTDGNSTTFSFDQTGVIPGGVNGLDRSFIRTTPNMSPPPGTTGYVPPATVAPTVVGPSGARSNGLTPATPANPAFSTPAIPQIDRSQVLPPPTNPVVTPVEIPTVDGATQITPQPPRNAWESFFD